MIVINNTKKIIVRILVILFMIGGVFAFLYPSIANYITNQENIRTIEAYNREISSLSEKELKGKVQAAKNYNKRISASVLDDEDMNDDVLTFQNGEMIGYIRIPKIKANIPIYEGTNEGVLNKGVGHVSRTSLPCGGESSHCAIAGHSGLSDSEMFTRLEDLEIGDSFIVVSLGQSLRYEVDEIKTMTPSKAENYVKIKKGKDYCTLITCTPVTVNSHRLLVRGKRVEVKSSKTEDISEHKPSMSFYGAGNDRVNNLIIPIVIIGVCVLALLMIIKRIRRRKRRNETQSHN